MSISTAVDSSAIARAVGIKTQYKNLRGSNLALLPQRIALVGQGSTAATFSTAKRQITSAFEAGSLYGFGSPIHLAAKQLFPANGDGVGSIPVTVYPLEDDASGVAAAGDITPSGTQTVAATYRVYAGNVPSAEFTIAAGDSVAARVAAIVAAINANVDMPVVAADNASTDVTITAKWKGSSGNSIVLRVEESAAGGTSFAFTQPTGGATNPDVDDALALMGDVWETLIVSCFEPSDSTTLGKYLTLAESRWGALVRKPLVALTGMAPASLSAATTITTGRTTDRANVLVPLPGSEELPLAIAARAAARVARVANEDPAMDYASQSLSGLTPGDDEDQWTWVQRDVAIKAGCSSTKLLDGIPQLSDVVTMYHPSGDPTPGYRYVCDIVKLQNILYSLDSAFNVAEWNGAPLIPDGQPTTNRNAKQPRAAKALVAGLCDSWANAAIISDPDAAKASIEAGINASNPKRLDISLTVKLSGNTNIISIDLNFGFYFGAA